MEQSLKSDNRLKGPAPFGKGDGCGEGGKKGFGGSETGWSGALSLVFIFTMVRCRWRNLKIINLPSQL